MSKDKTKAKESKAAVFFKGVKSHFLMIICPVRDTLVNQLAGVLVVTVLLGVVIALIDFGFQNLIDLLTGITIGG